MNLHPDLPQFSSFFFSLISSQTSQEGWSKTDKKLIQETVIFYIDQLIFGTGQKSWGRIRVEENIY
jgi:hypothetical protein